MQKLQHSFKVHHYLHKPRFYCKTICSAIEPDRFAIIGGGIAGVSTAFHLASLSHPSPIHIDLYDAGARLGAGGSGAAAGLLHPYNPRGNLLWNGLAAFQEALKLVEAAEAAEQAMVTATEEGQDDDEKHAADVLPFVWRHGVVRPARDDKQAKSIARNLKQKKEDTSLAELLTADALSKCVPGLHLPSHNTTNDNNEDNSAGFIVPSAIVLHPVRYLHALWKACQLQAASNGGAATLHLHSTINSIHQLHDHNHSNNSSSNGKPPYKAVIIAAGAAIGAINETKDTLPIELCQGYTLEMKHHQGQDQDDDEGEGGKYPQGAPSILGPTYIAAHGSNNLIIGATKTHGLTPEQALQQCLATNDNHTTDNSDSMEQQQQEATASLLKAAADIWQPLTNNTFNNVVRNSNSNWKVAAVKSGVRALPTRLPHLGSIPYAGRLETISGTDNIPCWVIGGLGSRGLLYHAWLGKVVAEGVLSGDEGGLPAELLRWKK